MQADNYKRVCSGCLKATLEFLDQDATKACMSLSDGDGTVWGNMVAEQNNRTSSASEWISFRSIAQTDLT